MWIFLTVLFLTGFICLFYIQNECFRDTVLPVPRTLVLLTIWSIYVSSGVSSDVVLSPLVADALWQWLKSLFWPLPPDQTTFPLLWNCSFHHSHGINCSSLQPLASFPVIVDLTTFVNKKHHLSALHLTYKNLDIRITQVLLLLFLFCFFKSWCIIENQSHDS